MPKYLIFLFLILQLSFAPPALAGSDPVDSDSPVTATVPAAPDTDNLPPTPPILLRIADDSATADPHPELVWTPSTDPDGNTITYTLYLDNVATFLGISNTGNSAGNGYTATIVDNEIRLLPTEALADADYTWYVRASDPSGNYSNSTIWDFTIDTVPPYFVITKIDTHQDLFLDSEDPSTVPDGTSFAVSGPKDIYFTVTTEPNTTIKLSFYDLGGSFIAQASATSSYTSLTVYPYTHLSPGVYTVQAVAIDHVFLTSTLPTFELVVIEPTATISLPGIPPLTIPLPPTLVDLPTTLSYLPATVARIGSRVNIAVAIFALLAVSLYLLLLLLKKRRYNLVLLNSQGTYLPKATIYHSIPDSDKSSHHLATPALLTHRAPFRHPLVKSDQGRAYIPHLARYSTLTIRTPSSLTILSISRYHTPITLIID